MKKRRQNILERCARLGDSDAMVRIGRLYELGKGVEKNPEKALDFYQTAAGKGNPLGMRVMGVAFRDGLGVRKNVAKARYWFEKAAEKGDVFLILQWLSAALPVLQESRIQSWRSPF